MDKKTTKNFEELSQLARMNLTFLRILRSYCIDETKMTAEMKDVVVAIDEMLPRQEKTVEILDSMTEA